MARHERGGDLYYIQPLISATLFFTTPLLSAMYFMWYTYIYGDMPLTFAVSKLAAQIPKLTPVCHKSLRQMQAGFFPGLMTERERRSGSRRTFALCGGHKIAPYALREEGGRGLNQGKRFFCCCV